MQASQGALDAPTALRGGSELSIASVGKATRVGERALRLPLILADGTGTTLRVVLPLELDVTPGDREG